MRTLDTTPLSEFGLSPTEIHVFLSLQKLGVAKAGDLIKASGVQNSVLHFTLARLVSHGIVSYIRRGKMKLYQAAPPSRLLELQRNRTERLEKFVERLELDTPSRDLPEAEIYEGINGLRNMCFKLIEDAVPGDEFLFFGFASDNPEFERAVYTFYREYTDIRLQRGLVLRGVAHESMRVRFKENKWPHKNIRFVETPIVQGISLCRDKVIIVAWKDSQVSFLLRNNSFKENLRDYFYLLWEQGKK